MSTLNPSLSTPNPNEEHPCRDVNQSSQQIQDDSMFWLKKFIPRGLSKENQMDWTKAIQLTKDTDLESKILLYLKKVFDEGVVDPPCYINEHILTKLWML